MFNMHDVGLTHPGYLSDSFFQGKRSTPSILFVVGLLIFIPLMMVYFSSGFIIPNLLANRPQRVSWCVRWYYLERAFSPMDLKW